MAEPQYERVRRVEEGHWWFTTLRELVASELIRRLPPGARVLDAGCGTGRVLRGLPASFERTGIDANPDAFGGEGERDGIRFVAASIDELPFEDGAFDAAFSLDVLSDARVDDPVAGARELRRVLRPGGTLLLHLPAYEWLRSGHDVVARTGRRYTRRRARALLREAGFAPVHLSYRVSAAFPLAALVRLLRRGGASTDVGPVPAPLNALLKTLGRLENRVATRVPLPFGLSVLAIAAAGAPARPTLYERALAHRRLVALGQFAVTGERLPRRHRLLAEALREGEHRFVVDLGCGNAPLLRFAAPERYVGIDAHEPSLAAGRHEHSGPGREFVLGELTEVDLTPFRGADAVVVSSVTHHLPDGEVVRLLDRVAAQVAPRRILLQDAQPTGPLGPLVEALDDGDHLRPRAELERLLRPHFDTRLLWTYDNPLRSFHQFLLELRPRASG